MRISVPKKSTSTNNALIFDTDSEYNDVSISKYNNDLLIVDNSNNRDNNEIEFQGEINVSEPHKLRRNI